MALNVEFCYVYRVFEFEGPNKGVVFASTDEWKAREVSRQKHLPLQKVLAAYIMLGEKITLTR